MFFSIDRNIPEKISFNFFLTIGPKHSNRSYFVLAISAVQGLVVVDVVGNNLGGNEGILGYWGSGCHYLEPAN